MSSLLPLTPPSALDYFTTLVADDDGFALLEAAIAVAQDEYPQLDVQAVLAEVDGLGLKLAQRIAADAPPLQRLRLLNRYFFEELGFSGNVNDYYDRRNSYLNDVIERRRGIPITLALLYLELAQHAGLQARGVAFPGHFLVKLKLPRGEVVIDPFNGRSLSREELSERLQPFQRRQGLAPEDEPPLGLYLQAAPARDVLARVLRNLKEIHRSAQDWPRALAVQERLVRLLPEAWEERRDRALVGFELGRHAAAVADLQAYLAHLPRAADAPAMRERLARWRDQGPPPLH